MASKIVTLSSVLRPDSNITKVYNELKDLKSHKLSVLRAKLKKAGIKKQLVVIFRLGRLLEQHEGKYVYIDYAADTVQVYKGQKFLNNRVGRSTTAKAPVKSSTKKTTVSRTKAKASNTKAVKSVKAAVTDDELLEVA